MFLDSVKYNKCSTFNISLVCVRKLTPLKMLPAILQECWTEATTPSSIKSKHLLCDRCSKFNLQFGEFPNVVLCAANANCFTVEAIKPIHPPQEASLHTNRRRFQQPLVPQEI
jgi:hypothetical protein